MSSGLAPTSAFTSDIAGPQAFLEPAVQWRTKCTSLSPPADLNAAQESEYELRKCPFVSFLFYSERIEEGLRPDRFVCSMFATENGFIGLAADGIVEEDCLVLVSGARLPFIMRRQGEHWLFRGCAWVFGIMGGQLMDYWKHGEPPSLTFSLS